MFFKKFVKTILILKKSVWFNEDRNIYFSSPMNNIKPAFQVGWFLCSM